MLALSYPLRMNKITTNRLLSLLLACVLLAQIAVNMAVWHIDFPLSGQGQQQTLHSAAMEQHLATHHADEANHNLAAEHHHYCGHCSFSSTALPFQPMPLFLAQTEGSLPTFRPDNYRNPLTDLLLRPPIA